MGLLDRLNKMESRPWLCTGNFNEILAQSEKRGIAWDTNEDIDVVSGSNKQLPSGEYGLQLDGI